MRRDLGTSAEIPCAGGDGKGVFAWLVQARSPVARPMSSDSATVIPVILTMIPERDFACIVHLSLIFAEIKRLLGPEW